MKTAAIVGSGSMLGLELATQLRARGVAVVTVGRRVGDDIALDLGVPGTTADTGGRRIDAIFHCAAAFGGDDETGVRSNFIVNALGAVAIAALARATEACVCVYAGSVSSNADFDSAGISSYGLSKAQGEQILAWDHARRNAAFSSLRLPQIYDTEGRCVEHQPWFGRVVAYASRGLDLELPASGGSRNFVHVEDAARLLIAAADTKLQGVFPVCHAETAEIAGIAEIAYAVFGRGGKARIDPTKAPFRVVRFPTDRTLYARLGDEPRIDLCEGIGRIAQAGTAGNFGPLDVA